MSKNLRIKIIGYNDHEYKETLIIRDEVLRKPLGLTLSSADIAGEEKQIHIGAFLYDKLVGCMVISPVGSDTARIRQVSVKQEMRGMNIGKALITFAEEHAVKTGFTEIILRARKTVEEFYNKSGYTRIGDEFIEKTIPHVDMRKNIKNRHSRDPASP